MAQQPITHQRPVIMNYWVNENTENNLTNIPVFNDVLNIVPLAFVGISPDFSLKWDYLLQKSESSQLKQSVKALQAQGAKVLLAFQENGILGHIAATNEKFIKNVVDAVLEWGVDGIDFDYEPAPFTESSTLVGLIKALRSELDKRKPGCIFTAPIFDPWLEHKEFLKDFCGALDYVSTMDYTPYPGYADTDDALNQYATIIGSWNKLLIGVSCMTINSSRDDGLANFTPLEDLQKLAAYKLSPNTEGPKGSKAGIMLWTHTYDVPHRNKDEGTGQPPNTWINAIHAHLAN